MPGRFLHSLVLLAFGVCLLAASDRATGQALEELRTDVRTSDPGSPGNSPPKSNSSSSGTSSNYDDPNDDWSLEELAGGAALAGAGITLPFWGPPLLAGDTYSQPANFLHFPYQYDQGYMLLGSLPTSTVPNWFDPYLVAARARSEFGTDFNNLAWVGGQIILETTPRLGLDSDFRYVTEKVSTSTRDSLWVGDANVLFRFTQSPWLIMRTGLGANFLSDTRRTDFGFNFTYGGDFFPLRPWVISSELDLGTLGHTNLYHFRGTIGANWRHSEAYVGYDYLDIGPTQIAGLVAGLRLWF
jgi:hypothetical protein